MRPRVKFEWKGNHHLYYGITFLGFGIFNMSMGWGNGPLDGLFPLWEFCMGLGGYMIVDDFIEHTITADTPARIIYRFLFGVRDHG